MHKQVLPLPSFAFPSKWIRHLFSPEETNAEVSMLSHEVMFQLLSISLQDGIGFVGSPIPAAPSAALTSRFPLRGNIGITHVPHEYQSRLGAAFAPVEQQPRQRTVDSLNLSTYLLV